MSAAWVRRSKTSPFRAHCVRCSAAPRRYDPCVGAEPSGANGPTWVPKTTKPGDHDEMIVLAKSAHRGAPQHLSHRRYAQGSYEICERDAVLQRLALYQGSRMRRREMRGRPPRGRQDRGPMVDAGILVMGHLGLTPQSHASSAAIAFKGKTRESFDHTMEDALRIAAGRRLRHPARGHAGGTPRASRAPVAHTHLRYWRRWKGRRPTGHHARSHGILRAVPPLVCEMLRPQVARPIHRVPGKRAGFETNGTHERRDGHWCLAEMGRPEYVKDVRDRRFPDAEYTYSIKEEDLAPSAPVEPLEVRPPAPVTGPRPAFTSRPRRRGRQWRRSDAGRAAGLLEDWNIPSTAPVSNSEPL